MADRSKNSPSSSKRKKLKFAPKPPVIKPAKQASKKIIVQEEKKYFCEKETKPVIDKEVMRTINTRQAVRKIAMSRADNADQKPQLSIQARVHSKKKKHEIEPYVVLPLRPDNTNSELLNKMEFGEASKSSIEIESSINPAKDLGLDKESENKRMLLFKLPKSLPIEKPASISQENEIQGKINAKNKLNKINGCNLQELPSESTLVGKMLVYKNGKVKMKLGDITFNVDPGMKCVFSQDVVGINMKKKHLYEIGKLDERDVVVTPDLDALLDDNKI
ncbi:hypothetical protein LUZ60_001922 [Juncus effusus]|nr:hypothetical protein LUZ60_001922 [Juncus effusus]